MSKHGSGPCLDRTVIEARKEAALQTLDAPKGSMNKSNLSDSSIVMPSLLMLDGSSLQHHKGEDLAVEKGITSSQVALPAQIVVPRTQNNQTGEKAVRREESRCSADRALSLRMSSLDSIRSRLADRYSDGYLGHVQSVLRCSLSHSSRSSLMSFSSMISWKTGSSSFGSDRGIDSNPGDSDKSFTQEAKDLPDMKLHGNETIEDLTRPLKPWAPKRVLDSIRRTNSAYQEEVKAIKRWEVKVWDLFIRDEKLQERNHPQFRMHRQYHTISNLGRTCCLPFPSRRPLERCMKCGFSPEHRRQIYHYLKTETASTPAFLHNLQDLDFYGNSLLHCMAEAVGPEDLDILWTCIDFSRDCLDDLQQTNTSGCDFLHLICRRGLNSTRSAGLYIKILKKLATLGFDFSKRDYHGRNILHCLIQNTKNSELAVSMLEAVSSITNLSINAFDNSGFVYSSILAPYESHGPGIIYPLGALAQSLPQAADVNIGRSTYLDFFKQKPSNEEIDEWLSELMVFEDLNLIDSKGDTPLTAFLKYSWESSSSLFRSRSVDTTSRSRWSYNEEIVKRMVEGGAEIQMRDRIGCTPIMIAAEHGHRPITAMLLGVGGNVNGREYERHGQSILQWIRLHSSLAGISKDERLYAEHLTCYNLLVDAGAKVKPTDEDEWMLPSARALLPAE